MAVFVPSPGVLSTTLSASLPSTVLSRRPWASFHAEWRGFLMQRTIRAHIAHKGLRAGWWQVRWPLSRGAAVSDGEATWRDGTGMRRSLPVHTDRNKRCWLAGTAGIAGGTRTAFASSTAGSIDGGAAGVGDVYVWDGPWHKPLSTQMGPHTCMANSKRDAARAGSLIRLDEQITLMPSAHPDAP